MFESEHTSFVFVKKSHVQRLKIQKLPEGTVLPGPAAFQGLKKSGASFRLFTYYVPFIKPALRYSSPVFIESERALEKELSRYNRLTSIYLVASGLCTFGIAPLLFLLGGRAGDTYRINRRGGIDITGEVEMNVETYDPATAEITFQYTAFIFDPPRKPEAKALQKALTKASMACPDLRTAYAGIYINSPQRFDDCPIELGFETTLRGGEMEARLMPYLRREFMPHVKFLFFTKDEDELRYTCLESQGTKVL